MDIIYPDDKEAVLGEANNLAKRPGDIIQQYRIIAKDGSIHWVEDHKTPLFADGKYQGVDGVVFDITERKLIEVENAELLQAIELSTEGINLTNTDGVLVSQILI